MGLYSSEVSGAIAPAEGEKKFTVMMFWLLWVHAAKFTSEPGVVKVT